MRSRVMALAGALLVMVSFGSNAIAQTEETNQARQERQGRMELTDAQKEQIAQLREQQREAAAEATAEIIKARAEVQSLMVMPDKDLNALQRAMNRLSELENGQKIQAMRNAEAFQDILTDEQKSQLRTGLRGNNAFFMQGRMGRGRTSMGRTNAFRGRGGNVARGRSQRDRFMQSRNRGRTGRGIPPTGQAGFGRVGRAGAAPPPMQGRFGNTDADERGMRMRVRIHDPGSAVPPPTTPPPPPIG